MKKNIFITGASGFLGGYLIQTLLKDTPHNLYCLIRPGKRITGEQRLSDKFADFLAEHSIDPSRLIPLVGDMVTENLGLPENLELDIDELWHCAAVMHFEHHKKKETIATNCGGMKRILGFLKKYNIPHLNFVSTAYVAGRQRGSIPEESYEHQSDSHNPYELSKRMCEQELLNYREIYEFTYRIFRPSIIIGDSKNYGVDSNSGLYGYLAILLRLKDKLELKMPDYFKYNSLKVLISEEASLNLICVDHVVKLFMAVAFSDQTLNDVFHLTNPNPTPLSRYTGVMGDAFGITCTAVYDEEELGAVDRLLLQEEDIFESYLQTVHYFECDKAFAVANMDKDLPTLGAEVEYKITLNVKKKFDENKFVQRKRLRSVTHRLERKSVHKEGKEELSYYTGGEGPALVIFNAYGQSLSFWDWAVTDLYKRYTVYIWSMRGTASQEGGVKEVFPVEYHVADALDILEQEQVESAYFMAWCTGPKIALLFQEKYPEKVKSMIFLNGCFKGVAGFEAYHTPYENNMQQICDRIDANPALASLVMSSIKNVLIKDQEVIEYDELKASDEKGNLVDDVLSMIGEDIKPMILEPFLSPSSILNYGRQLLLLWDIDVTDRLKNVNVPVLFVTGREDNIASCEISIAASQLSDYSTCAVIEGGTHYPHFDNAKILVALADEFFTDSRLFDFEHGLVHLEKKANYDNVINT